MAADSTTQLQGLIDRMVAGDVSARNELIDRAYQRLRRLAHKMLQGFPRVRRFEDTGDVLHDSLPRLSRALESVPPASVAEFFGLASRQMRWELLDLVRRYCGPEGLGGKQAPAGAENSSESIPPADRPTSSYNPPVLAFWTEFHKAVEGLPEEERDVFQMWWYQDMTQAEVASVLRVPTITVRRRLVRAKRRLGKYLPSTRDD